MAVDQKLWTKQASQDR